MRSDGRARYMRATSGRNGYADTVTFVHYTGRPVRGCDGTPRAGELVVEYESNGSIHTVTARPRSALEINDSAFDMLAGRVPVTADPIQLLDGRTVRPFSAPYRLHDGAQAA